MKRLRARILLFTGIALLAGVGAYRHFDSKKKEEVGQSWVLIGTLTPANQEQVANDLDSGDDVLAVADHVDGNTAYILAPSDRQHQARLYVRQIAKAKGYTFTEK